MTRTKYTVEGQFVTQTCTSPWTGDAELREYRCPVGGGYVSVRYNGVPGWWTQPHTDGSTWTARDVPGLLALIKREWRAERAQAESARRERVADTTAHGA